VLLPGVSHFFQGSLVDLKEAVTQACGTDLADGGRSDAP
jgi:hypothetical protein